LDWAPCRWRDVFRIGATLQRSVSERGEGRQRRRTKVEGKDLGGIVIGIVSAHDEEVGPDLGSAVREATMDRLELDLAPHERVCKTSDH
jgi:hypothetical protein